MNLEKILSKKITFITGKGGVGKSTISSALSYHLAKKGNRVLIIDADPAHSLPDTFGITKKVYGSSKTFSNECKLVRVYDDTNLDLLLLNPIVTRDRYVNSHRIMWLGELGKEIGFYSNLGRMSEFFTLSDALWKLYGRYDKIIIDNEPSAGTLDMIESIDGWIDGIENVNKYKPIFNLMLSSSIIDRELATEVRAIIYSQNGEVIAEYKRMLQAIKKVFTDKTQLEPIIISSPEDAVIRETYRLKKELEDTLTIQNNNIIFNKVMMDSANTEDQIGKIEKFKKESKVNCLIVPYINPSRVNLEDESSALLSLRTVADSIVTLGSN